MVGETAKRKRAPFLALLLVMLVILLHTTRCEATASIMKDNATSSYHARMEEPADYWMFDSEITRMLAGSGGVTGNTGKGNKPAIMCQRGKPYYPCVPKPNSAPRGPNCDPLYRGPGCN
ncbi:hypothetical protein FH972_027081 [Carpinus fangiana]|uniref:Uncharacterized protein n=1 Tax=Carpinus fangiana TaxID=176857 RepID=A0A5N6L5Y2_9ROSI|nr:hypothetical protein FH972_027081 [Carpinus fangiana]